MSLCVVMGLVVFEFRDKSFSCVPISWFQRIMTEGCKWPPESCQRKHHKISLAAFEFHLQPQTIVSDYHSFLCENIS